MLENKISVLDEQFRSVIHQLKALELMSPQELLQHKEHQKNILTAQVEIVGEYLRKIIKDLDSPKTIEAGQEEVEKHDQQLSNPENKGGLPNDESETVPPQTNLGEERMPVEHPKYNLEVEKDLINQYNDILCKNASNLDKENMIKQIWSTQGLELMFMPNLENVRCSQTTPELNVGNPGNFYGIPQDNYYFIFPLPSINVTNDVIQYTFNIEGDGQYVNSVGEAAKFEKQGDIVRLMKKGRIIARS